MPRTYKPRIAAGEPRPKTGGRRRARSTNRPARGGPKVTGIDLAGKLEGGARLIPRVFTLNPASAIGHAHGRGNRAGAGVRAMSDDMASRAS